MKLSQHEAAQVVGSNTQLDHAMDNVDKDVVEKFFDLFGYVPKFLRTERDEAKEEILSNLNKETDAT